MLGVLFVILSSLTYAIYIVGVNRSSLKELPTAKLTFYALLFGLSIYVVRLDFCTALQPGPSPCLLYTSKRTKLYNQNKLQMKKHNFNAGPSILPREVIEDTAKAILDFNEMCIRDSYCVVQGNISRREKRATAKSNN